MNGQQKITPESFTLNCHYSTGYESIYDSSYGTNFVFYDEEELEGDDCALPEIPSPTIAPSGLFHRYH